MWLFWVVGEGTDFGKINYNFCFSLVQKSRKCVKTHKNYFICVLRSDQGVVKDRLSS